MDRCAGDDTFGPSLDPRLGNCYEFDFTLVFEEAIFLTAPCALVIPIVGFRLYLILKPSSFSAKRENQAGPVIHWPLVRALKLVSSQ